MIFFFLFCWWIFSYWGNDWEVVDALSLGKWEKCGSQEWERTLTSDGLLRWIGVRTAQAQILCWLYEFWGCIPDEFTSRMNLLIHTTLIVECYCVVAGPGENPSNESHTCSVIGELVQEKKYYRKGFCILLSWQDDLASLTVWIWSSDSHMAQGESLRAVPWYSHTCYGLWYTDVSKWKWNKL